MADILIRGMEMPTGAEELRLIIRSNGQVIISKQTYWEETEAIEVTHWMPLSEPPKEET